MSTLIKKVEDKRIEFRVSEDDKALLEYASVLGGFKKKSEFYRAVLFKAAKALVAEEKQILASKKDKEIFFNALMGKVNKPNQALASAISYHDEMLAD